MGLTPLVVAIDELGAIGYEAKRKAELIALLTQIALKVAQKWRYSCDLFAVR